MINFDHNRAFAPLTEPLHWRQDKSPHKCGTIHGVVLHGAPDSQNAGHPSAAIVADPWTVTVAEKYALVADAVIGDTLRRIGIRGETLTIQQIARDESGWVLTCTANERPPAR